MPMLLLPHRKGSVVVNYKVLLHPPARDKPTTSLDHQVQKLLEAANTAAQGQNCTHSTSRCQATAGQGWSPTSLVTSRDRCPLFLLPEDLCFSTSSSRTVNTNMSVLNATGERG